MAFLRLILLRIPTQYPKIGSVWAIDDVAKVQKCLKMKTLVQRWYMGVGSAVSSFRQLIIAVEAENIRVFCDCQLQSAEGSIPGFLCLTVTLL